MNIYIKMEVKNRELEGRLLLGLAAAERGHTVLLGTQSLTVQAAIDAKLEPGIVHEKSIPPARRRIEQLESLVKIGCVCTSQDEESGLLTEDYSPFAARRFSYRTLSLVKRAFAWGEHDYRGIVEMYPDAASKIQITGNPRVDLWRPDFHEYFRIQETGDYSGYILFPSNFLSILHQHPLWHRLKAERELGHYAEGRLDEFQRYDIEAFRVQLLSYFVKAIRNIANEFPAHNIIVRPHPQESEEAWWGYLGNIPNVHVVKSGGISSWIRNAAVVVHNSCTSALEAAACGKPMIAYCPVRSELGKDIPNLVSLQITSEKDLVEALKQVLNTGNLPSHKSTEKASDLLRGRFANLEGTLAADRVVDEWEKLDNGQLSRSNRWSQFKFRSTYRGFVSRTTMIRNVSKRKSKLLNNKLNIKFPALTQQEVTRIVERYRFTLKRFSNVEANVLDSKLILIQAGRSKV